jgi:predicted Zn-dependent protease
MVARQPDNALARFGVATEALKAGLHEEAVDQFRAYLSMYQDEGNAWLRLAEALAALGRVDEARQALRSGIETAGRFGHPGMAAEMEERLDALGA